MKRNLISDYFKLEIIAPKDFKKTINIPVLAFAGVFNRITCKTCKSKMDVCLSGDRYQVMKDHLWLHINEKKLEVKKI